MKASHTLIPDSEVLYTMDTFWAPTKWDGTADRLSPGWFIADVLTQSTTYKEILILLKARKRQYACTSTQKYTWKRKGSILVTQRGCIWLFLNLYLVCLVYQMERLLGADYKGSLIVQMQPLLQNMQNQMTTATAFQIPATALPFLAVIVVEATINTEMAPLGIRKYNERLSMTVHTLWQWSTQLICTDNNQHWKVTNTSDFESNSKKRELYCYFTEAQNIQVRSDLWKLPGSILCSKQVHFYQDAQQLVPLRFEYF